MRLHIKVFLWFWLGVVVVSGTLIGLTELTHSRAQDDRLWREKYGPRVDLWARQETHILRTKGSGGARGVRRIVPERSGRAELHVRRQRARGVRPHAAAAGARRCVDALMQSAGWTQHVDPVERIIAERVIDANGNPYVVVVDFPARRSCRARCSSCCPPISVDGQRARRRCGWPRSSASPGSSASCWPGTSPHRSTGCARPPRRSRSEQLETRIDRERAQSGRRAGRPRT